MKKHIKAFIANPLISGSSIVFAGGMLSNVLNFVFNIIMIRSLSVSDYGILTSLISLLTLASLPISALLPTIMYFSASYFANEDYAMVRGLYAKITKPMAIVGLILCIIAISLRSHIAGFLNINNDALIIPVALGLFVAFTGVANIPLLQAKLAFVFVALITAFSTFLKLIFGIISIETHMYITGIIWGMFIAAVAPYLISFTQLKFLLQKNVKVPHISIKDIFSYAGPATVATFSLSSFITVDLILAKHFFNPVDAGVYAALSLIGRVIFFFSAPIATVMFPIVVQKYTRKENFNNVFMLASLLVFLPSVAITIFYFLFPEFVVRVFGGKQEVVDVKYLLGPFGIYGTVYALLFIFTNFFLSIKKTYISIPLAIGALSQAVLIWFIHDSIWHILIISLSIAILLLVVLLLYYWRLYAKKR